MSPTQVLVTDTPMPVVPWLCQPKGVHGHRPNGKRPSVERKGVAEGSEVLGNRGCRRTWVHSRVGAWGTPGCFGRGRGGRAWGRRGVTHTHPSPRCRRWGQHTGERGRPSAWSSAAAALCRALPAPLLRPWFQSSLDYTLFALVDSTFTCTCQARCK